MQIICSWANGQVSEFQYPERHWVKQMGYDYYYLLQVTIMEGKLWPGALYRVYQFYEVGI